MALQTNIQDIKQGIDLRNIVERAWGPAKRRGHDHSQWSSPERRDSNPSFTVYQTRFIDYGDSDRRGDVFDFLKEYMGLDFKQALEYLTGNQQQQARPVPPQKQTTSSSSTRATFPQWKKALTAFVGTASSADYAFDGLVGQDTLYYLMFERGLKIRTIMRFKLFTSGTTWRDTGYTKADGKRAMIAPFSVCIPYYNQQGQMVKLRYRLPTLKDGQPDALGQGLGLDPAAIEGFNQHNNKYMQVAEGDTTAHFGYIVDDRPLYIVEGEFDVMAIWQQLGSNAGAITMGSASSRLSDGTLDQLRAVSGVIIATDNDTAGQGAAEKYRAVIAERWPMTPVIIAPVPDGYKDANEALVGGADFGQWLADCEKELAALTPAPAGVWKYGLPDKARLLLLQLQDILGGQGAIHDHAPAAALWESINAAAPSGPFTAADAIGWSSLSRQAVYNGLKALEKLGILVDGGFFSEFSPSYNTPFRIGENFGKNPSQGGRPSKTYHLIPTDKQLKTLQDRLLTVAKVVTYSQFNQLDRLGLAYAVDSETAHDLVTLVNDYRFTGKARVAYSEKARRIRDILKSPDYALSTPLNGAGWANAKEYRLAFYNAYRLANSTDGGQRQIATFQAAGFLGVTAPTLRTYRKELGIAVDEQYQSFCITSGHDLKSEILSLAPFVENRPKLAGCYVELSGEKRWLYAHDDSVYHARLASLESEVQEQLKGQLPVTLWVQVAGIERDMTADELAVQAELKAKEAMQDAGKGQNVDTIQDTDIPDVRNDEDIDPTPAAPLTIEDAYHKAIVRVLTANLDKLLPAAIENARLAQLLTSYGLRGAANATH